jgi:predicted house-cleaning noncanonical NTP pyrophosphatase (MazG superfamily)
MKRYDKLIRDKIPEIIAADGKKCKTRVLSQSEMQKHLIAKLQEEVDELQKQPCIEEIADVLEVLMSLAIQMGSNMDEVEHVRRVKHAKRGGFEKRLFLEYVQ